MRLKTWTPLEIIETILAINVLVWGVVFLFPGNVFDTSRYQYSAIYAQDWFWGILLAITGSLLLFLPKIGRFRLRRYLHIFCWLFWFSMSTLLGFRTFENGLAATDFLFLSVFISITLIHLTLYNRLVGIK